MTQAKRLILNVFASHCRALVVMFCGLLTGRWMLQALGQVDYGLLGLIGGFILFISLINNILASAVSRYFAYAVGEARETGAAGVENCRRWFNVALLVHTVVPIVLVLIGYPIGGYAVEHWLNIPPDRLADSVWVFRIVCLSALIGMITVPYRAMYTAKQFIVEVTVYSFVFTILNVIVLYYFVEHPRTTGSWLVPMAAWMAIQTSATNIILWVRSYWIFPECKIVFSYMKDLKRLREIAAYAGWQFLGSMGSALRMQGIAILVNKFFSPIMNSSYTVANTVAGHSQMLAREVDLAFSPAIASAYGAHDESLCRQLVYRCSKISAWLVAVFILPLILEMKEVLVLWLKDPPPYTAGICICLCLMLLVEKLASGQYSAVRGTGKIRPIQCAAFCSYMGTLLVTWIGFGLGVNMYMVGFAFLMASTLNSAAYVYYARRLANVPCRPWLRDTCALLGATFVCAVIAYLPQLVWAPSFSRVCITTLVFVGLFLPISWRFVLSREEKDYIVVRVRKVFAKLFGSHQKTGDQ